MTIRNKFTFEHTKKTIRANCQHSLLLGSLLLSTLAMPVVANTNQTTTYQASFFTQYAPSNALEMIKLLPGFTFNAGHNSRGFGGNAGNVLIDGVRPASKSGGITAALTRLPANQVARIELLPGNAGEAGGHALIANVVSIKSQTSGSWTMRARQTRHTKTRPNVEAVLRMPLGQWNTAFNLDIGIFPFYRTANVEQYNNQDELISQATESYASNNRIDYFNGEGSRALAGGKLTLNGRLARDKRIADLLQNNIAASSLWSLDIQNHIKQGEFGIDWAKTTNDWKLRLLGLAVRNNSQYQYDYHLQSLDQSFGSHYQQDRLKTEYVGRVTYGRVDKSAIKPEFGFEVANNRLDTNARAGQVNDLQPVFGSDVIVKELRNEAFANFVYQANTALAIEGGLTYETSEIKVSGDALQDQSFSYIKPRLTASYKINPDTRLTIEAHRSVGQLSFNDFAANSVAIENRTNAGNSKLSPDQIDELSTTFDWRFSERGSLKVKAYHQWRSDILEQIILSTDDNGNIEQGLGNAGDAKFWSIRTTLKLPVDNLIPNGLIDFSHRYTKTNFDDPIINSRRSISNNTPEWFRFKFRQDLTAQQFSWGFEYWDSYSYDGYLVDEIQTSAANPTLKLFAETSRYFGVKIQLEVINANTNREPFTRRYYQNTRAGDYLGKEVAKREQSPYFILSVIGKF